MDKKQELSIRLRKQKDIFIQKLIAETNLFLQQQKETNDDLQGLLEEETKKPEGKPKK